LLFGTRIATEDDAYHCFCMRHHSMVPGFFQFKQKKEELS